jgi:predicted AAA+ superfamily ATPase
MDLTDENPWWNEGGLWQDSDLMRVKASPLRYHPTPFSPLDCAQPNVFTLRGPRRAGKTVALKLLVAELTQHQGWKPSTIT